MTILLLNYPILGLQCRQPFVLSPPPQPILLDSNKSRTGTLTIVDYCHDEVAVSPEAEVTLEEKPPPGVVYVLTPSTQATPPQSSELLNPSV
ncbi:hypothetical protein F0562_013914 [Nyssa sinensis]|uniref:Uncharacterized protein n=1 Tax=Nyssa sinensis TaxID=561372 RepID=A0A5J4ZRD5_9ASTE|nr:hypothetical protein F0562_013914 [Nyssa sinensis]